MPLSLFPTRTAVNLGLTVLWVTGCATATAPAPVVARPPALVPSGPAWVSRAGVTFDVQPLGYAERAAGKLPKVEASWGEIDHTKPAGGASLRRFEVLPLVPVPSFAFVLDNHGGAPIAFRSATIALQSARTRHRWEAMLVPEDVAARVERLTRARFPNAHDPRLYEELRDTVMQVPLLTRETIVADGARLDGVLVIDFHADDGNELARVLADDMALELRIEAGELTIVVPIAKRD